MKKNGQLVCQYLEYVSTEIFVKYQPIIKEYIKGRHGIYALYKKDKLVYVGLASDMIHRLKTHNKRDKHAGNWDRFSIYLTVSDSHLKELESLLLRIASPKRNTQSGKFKKAENIQRKLKKDIKDFNSKELEYLLRGKKKAVEEIAEEIVSGRTPTLAKYISRSFRILMTYKKKKYWATVKRDGRIKFKNNYFTSPSVAAFKVSKSGHSMDGWHWWKYERGPGEWVKIDELRK